MQVTFTGKIPISKCNVLDTKTGQYVNTTLYEYDCSDEEDFKEVKNAKGIWSGWCDRKEGEPGFSSARSVAREMERKHYCVNLGWDDQFSPLQRYELHTSRFYSLQTKNGDIIGICQTHNPFPNHHFQQIKRLATEGSHRYKYAGQSILASLAKRNLDKYSMAEMSISDFDYDEDYETKFYTDKCGFEQDKDDSEFLSLDTLGSYNLVRDVETKTRAPIINIQA